MALITEAVEPVALAARVGLSSQPKTLAPWLFYDELGSQLFEQITELPEYYLTRTERGLLRRSSAEIVAACGPCTVVELGAGTATKTGILLEAAVRAHGDVLYQPIDVSPTVLELASRALEATLPGVRVDAQVANYVTDSYRIEREAGRNVLALYIGSSIGNFSPAEAAAILAGLRAALRPGDHLLLGTDLAPAAVGAPGKTVRDLVAAYDDAQGVTAAFNRNVLARLNREMGANFRLECFRHQVRWNAAESRMEMHLESLARQEVRLPASPAGGPLLIPFVPHETIHTENSYKFTAASIRTLLRRSGFEPVRTFRDSLDLFAVTLAAAF